MSHAEETLLEVLRTIAAEQGYKDNQFDFRPVTSGGANYTSKLYLATISSRGKKKLNLFAKIGSFSEQLRAQVDADRLFRTEHFIYTKLVKIWDSLQEIHNVEGEHRLFFPKYYGGNLKTGSETVVLEDLAASGYYIYDRFKSVDWEHASKSIETLAKYHAISFVLEKEDPEEFAICAEKLKFEIRPEDENMKDVFIKMLGGALRSLEEGLRNKVAKCFQNMDVHKMYNDFNIPKGRTVLVHGDYRTSNLLFRRQNDELQVLPIDYQTVHAGCPASDFIYFLVTATDEEFRRDHYQQLADHYHQTLGIVLQRYRINIDDVYPLTQFQDDLKQLLPAALLLGVMLLPVVVVDAENAPRTDSATGMDSFIVEPNQLFADRLSGLVRDLVRWKVI